MILRTYRLLGDSALAAAKAAVLAGIERWEHAWGAKLPTAGLQLKPASALAETRSEWQQWQDANGNRIWLAAPEGLARVCERLLFGERQQAQLLDRHLDSPIAQGAAADAAQALLQALAEAGQGSDMVCTGRMAPTDELFRHGAGVVALEWSLVPGKPLLVLYPKLVAAPIKGEPAQPVARLMPALASQPLRLTVELGQVELTLGQLESLHVGDVIRLDKHLDDTLLVQGLDGSAVCLAHAGRHDTHRAIEVQKLNTAKENK